MADETVKIRIAIDIQSESTYDTGKTVAEWLALTDEQRSDIKAGFWNEESENDNGGVWVETKGAEGT
ncbi:hypothetical protein GCM10010399_63860 [Dactylosporangium fulvum]|uniref:DUF4287 domain-containing protein n=1 Tax=Dactylosporangium fulvum TaxID=53359 RepID=A0ABY5W8Z8_9ACTN|nr:DUF4287 domain-containing protein [Dactylosporangium fulvum]UWP85791.1 DUF4287 domain-containing protein [Dactylosporangium fulvum]